MLTIFNQVLILFAFAATGFLFAKTGKLKTEHSPLLSGLLVYVFLPLYTFETFSKSFTREYISGNYSLILWSLGIVIVLAVTMTFFSKLFDKRKYERDVYEYSLIHDGGKSYAAVSEKGGHVLYVLPEYRRHEEKIDAETLMGEAVRFLFRKGFGEFTTAYFRKYDGVLTVNLAPLQDEVILYPDLIKLEMSMETGKIIGIECTDYFANHTARDIPEPGYGMADILARIGESVYADSVRRAIIPYNAGERQVWESHVISGRDEYLIYSDADTGEEILIYQLVHMADGTIVQ